MFHIINDEDAANQGINFRNVYDGGWEISILIYKFIIRFRHRGKDNFVTPKNFFSAELFE